MSNRNRKHTSGFQCIGKRRVTVLGPYIDVLTDEMKASISHQCARQQPAFTKYLKAVTDSENEFPFGRELLHRLHHRRKSCQGSGPQVISLRKSARNDHRVVSAEV